MNEKRKKERKKEFQSNYEIDKWMKKERKKEFRSNYEIDKWMKKERKKERISKQLWNR